MDRRIKPVRLPSALNPPSEGGFKAHLLRDEGEIAPRAFEHAAHEVD